MRIIDAEALHVRHALVVPAGPAGVFNEARESLFLRLSCDDGTVGWGETYTLPGNKEVLRRFAADLIGSDPVTVGRPLSVPVVDEVAVASAAGAVDMALFDLRGKALGVPAHVLLGGAVRTRVSVYASGFLYRAGQHPRDTWLPEARSLLERGFRAMKIRMGAFPLAEELPLIEQLRSFVPDEVRLMVDAWGAYPLPDALRVGRCLQDLGVTWFEEPASPYANYAGYETLTAGLDIAVAGGEMGRTVGEFKHWFDRGVLDIVQPDIAICGGLRSAAAVADLGRLYGIACVPHTWNGAVMAAATLQLIATLAGPSHVDLFADPPLEYDTSENHFMRDIVRDPPQLVDGYFDVPSQPGLGIDIDEGALRRYIVA